MDTTPTKLSNSSNDSSRRAALEATRRFPPGTVGYGVHAAIQTISSVIDSSDRIPESLPFFGGGPIDSNSFDAEIGNYFKRPDIQRLMGRRFDEPGGREANLKVATGEYEYWREVRARSWQKISSLQFNQEDLSDFIGGSLGAAVPPQTRATLQKLFASGRAGIAKAKSIISRTYNRVFGEVTETLDSIGIGESNLSPAYLGDVGDSGVFRVNLAESGLTSIQSITIEDDNVISGGTGAASGFDLDMIKLSPVLTNSAFQASFLVGSNAFTFSDLTTSFQPGFLQPWQSGDPEIWNQDRLFGTAGLRVNFPSATLGVLDGENGLEFGGVSIGEGGKITFTLNSPISSANLYLYVADVGGGNDSFRVKVSSVSNPNSQQGLTLQGTFNGDVIDLVQGFNGLVGRGNDNISGGAGNDRIFTATGNDTVNGDTGDDVLDGGQGNDKVFGGEGNDYLLGQVGNDQLVGGSGVDALDGGQGNNRLTGGSDRDIFVLSRGNGKSIIQDFRPRQDFLGLSKGIKAGNLDVVQRGRNVLISRGSDQLALLLGVQIEQIRDSNFIKV
ncbi:MAG: calcium-binding protein [Leptolyngbyaceae cyanobacterium bins.302]|nr:calcium-binding protein [Leptolyngbyaceae cyanobacterium bins.302]